MVDVFRVFTTSSNTATCVYALPLKGSADTYTHPEGY